MEKGVQRKQLHMQPSPKRTGDYWDSWVGLEVTLRALAVTPGKKTPKQNKK